MKPLFPIIIRATAGCAALALCVMLAAAPGMAAPPSPSSAQAEPARRQDVNPPMTPQERQARLAQERQARRAGKTAEAPKRDAAAARPKPTPKPDEQAKKERARREAARAARQKNRQGQVPRPRPKGATVYDKQPDIVEKELSAFLDLLPAFRSWAHANHEEAHPQLTKGMADFLYSKKAAEWVEAHGWQPVRFFCVMGRMAAALVIIEEGNDMKGTRPQDMPEVSPAEIDLARRHLGTILKAGGSAPPINHVAP